MQSINLGGKKGSDAMKVANVEFVKLDKEIPVYDVVNTTNHNFLIPTNDGRKIVSHNCGLMTTYPTLC